MHTFWFQILLVSAFLSDLFLNLNKNMKSDQIILGSNSEKNENVPDFFINQSAYIHVDVFYSDV